ncbi:hypothetical protein IID24_04690, partial [Patescibacteria group bacterium]|nr:hypothetical protein [Patescibacteria group bacterium]
MPNFSEKMVIYLDQNFLSEIAKHKDPRKNTRPEFERIFELLHDGFREEKLVVPKSWFHKLETSLSPQLREIIRKYQGFLGQIDLQHPHHVYTFQFGRAAKRFLGEKVDLVVADDVFHD